MINLRASLAVLVLSVAIVMTALRCPADEIWDLVPVAGAAAEETLPQTLKFRFGLLAFIMPLKDGEYALNFSPYIKPTETSDLGDFMVSGWLIDQESDTEIASLMVMAQDTVETVALKANRLYRLEITSMKNETPADLDASVIFPSGLAVAIVASEEKSAWVTGIQGVIMVPGDCKEILCFGEPRLSLISPSNKRIDVGGKMLGPDGLARIPVEPGEDGQTWTVGNQTRGKVFFSGEVPPLINLNQSDLLLPKGD